MWYESNIVFNVTSFSCHFLAAENKFLIKSTEMLAFCLVQ